MKKMACGMILMMGCITAACNALVAGGTASITASAVPATASSLASATEIFPPTGVPAVGAEEAIMILEPGPGSRLVSPLHLAGMADSTFEQVLAVRLVSFEGGLLEEQASVMIGSEMGMRGPFSAELAFSVDREQSALIQVLAYSPRDGGVTHLSSVGVTLLPGGAAQIKTRNSYPEQIMISQPAPGSIVSGGVMHVEGVAIASFEGTLVVEIYDESGNLLASEPLIVTTPEMGLPGTFNLDLVYSISSAGSGRVVVLDPSAAFDGFNHLASVEVRLQP